MKLFARTVIIGGLTSFIFVIAYVSTSGRGLKTINNAKIIQAASKDCPGLKDEYGNCLQANYRSAYYRDFYFDNSSFGRGK